MLIINYFIIFYYFTIILFYNYRIRNVIVKNSNKREKIWNKL